MAEIMLLKMKGIFFESHALLILDSMSAHHLGSVKEECKKMPTMLAVIPGGLIKILQPLDLTMNRSFKNEVRKLWEE